MPTSNLTRRILTAAALLPLLLVLLFLGPAWALYLLVLVACAVSALELFAMTHPGDRVAQTVGAGTTTAVSAAMYGFGSDPKVLATLVVAVPLVGALATLWRLGEIRTTGFRVMAGIAGPWYIGGLLTCVALLRRDQAESGASWVLMTLSFAWLGDTGGYFVGRFFGRHKLYPAVSPKKTWEGLGGSVIGAVLGGLGCHLWLLPALPMTHALGLVTLAGGLGQLGDLTESLLKRSAGVKDSGFVIPGHGGLLDRIDALLFTAPVVYLYTLWHPL